MNFAVSNRNPGGLEIAIHPFVEPGLVGSNQLFTVNS
jgi:hypothetical protein